VPAWSKDPRDRIKAGRGTLRKHAASKVWYFHYRDDRGKWKSVSTGHRDKAGAIEWALGHSLELTRIEKGLIQPGEKVTNDAIRKAADEWLDYIQSQRKPGTHRSYTSCVNNLKRYLDTRPSIRRLDQFDPAEVLKYREWLLAGGGRRRKNQKKTVDNNLVGLRAFFNWCVALRKTRANPIRESKTGVQVFFKERRPDIETYTRGEYAKILRRATPDLARKCRFLAASGLRIDELAHLEASDIDLQSRWLHVRAKTTHDGIGWSPKDDTDRRLPLNDDLRTVAAELLADLAEDQNAYLFPSRPGRHRAKNFARTTLSQLKKLSESTGIPKSKLTSHNFRRYFVSQCADCGIDILCVMEWVGHDDWEMVRRYYRLRDEHARASMRRFTTGTPERDGEVEGRAVSQRGPSRRFGEHVGKRADERRTNEAGRRAEKPSAA
jgi:integrase